MWDIIIASFVIEMRFNKTTKVLKEKDYKICQYIIKQMRNNMNTNWALYCSYQFKSRLKKT